MPNRESIASVPVNVTDAQSLRMFLLTLVERLDVVLGYRGNFALVSSESIFGPGGLAEQVEELARKQTGPTVRPLVYSPEELDTPSAAYEEAEAIAQVAAINELQSTLSKLIINLKTAGIIAREV